MVLWEVFLVVFATTAIGVIGQDPHDWDSDILQEQDDISDAEYLISQMEDTPDLFESVGEIWKNCIPTLSCTLVGGYCVKKNRDCNGTLDRFGCMGKKCKCCIQDNIVCGPASPTTLAPTTSGGAGSLTWHFVGNDSFVSFREQSLNWNDARDLCAQHGLELYIPEDSKAISKYLDESSYYPNLYWIGGRGDGKNQVWLSGNVVPDYAYGHPACKDGQTNHCMILDQSDYSGDKLGSLCTLECNTELHFLYPLCGWV